MSDILTTLVRVAKAAIEADDAEERRKFLHGKLGAAYHRWKMLNNIERVERETRDWSRMMQATKAEYSALEEAKRIERNAKRRLKVAVVRARVDVLDLITGRS